MPVLDYECDNGHLFQASKGRDREKCPTCGLRSPIIWLSPRSPHRQLQTPIVVWEYPDGTVGVAGGADSRTPLAAHRRELRSVGEYRKFAKTLNSQLAAKDSKREEAFLAMKERMEHEQRSRLSHLMGQESDPVARDIYREALEHNKGGRRPREFQEYFSVAMEMDKSNYDG